ncbi:hypothetical protein A3K42_01840 [candidate division WWE3 bacterium RBG_13_37_7]|uniref:Methylated-DNA-[protein]-cysteine S-methyltransferase DNA binding domain-containing protein n=1 Tax=candidate division WWE3 bacterium RBG_13_37_7 TaxID=1802609 RepID=A0A1F4U0L0_UNCKA|nr:MAG: hypothetical protein A3K42_01840 [candidate division WWE3 bacterium RBG_13_37_7]
MTNFKNAVIKAVNSVPKGKVASYGQIALMVGQPRAARQVGWILNGLRPDIETGEVDIPWWRIINNAGRISIKTDDPNAPLIQRQLLEDDGVVVDENLMVDMSKYRLRP